MNTNQPVSKFTRTVAEYFDEEGNITSRDTVEELEFWAPEQTAPVQPQWRPYITNTSNNSHVRLSDGVE